MNCETCSHWWEKGVEDKVLVGTCHRRPPMRNHAHDGDPSSDVMCWQHPLTLACDGCGEWLEVE